MIQVAAFAPATVRWMKVVFDMIAAGVAYWAYLGMRDRLDRRFERQRDASLERSRARYFEMVEEHEAKIDALNEQYGMPKGYRSPGYVKENRFVEVDAELAAMRLAYLSGREKRALKRQVREREEQNALCFECGASATCGSGRCCGSNERGPHEADHDHDRDDAGV